MNRRDFIANMAFLGLAAGRGRASALAARPGAFTGAVGAAHPLIPFHVTLPRHAEVLPFGSSRAGAQPAFALRGTKGYGWSEEQYLRQIPVMAEYKLNFLMNGYESLWELGPHDTLPSGAQANFWYKPLSAKKRGAFGRVIRSSHRHGVEFCFSMNPNLRSDRPFEYGNAADLESLWQHYAWAQELGVRWFNISLDDVHTGIDGAAQAHLVNTIYERLRKQDRQAQMVFAPTWYAGTGETGVETAATLGATAPGSNRNPGIEYTRLIADMLDSDIYLFWTGPIVCSLEVNPAEVRAYRALSKHRIVLWDNYPVNDRASTLHLGPLTGRSVDLPSEVFGYMSNPMASEDEANRIPLLTIADYAWNPSQYDPDRSIGQSILHFSESPSRREALRQLTEFYPGRLWDGSTMTGWNSLRERFKEQSGNHNLGGVRELVGKAKGVLTKMQSLFPDRWSSGWDVLQEDVSTMTPKMVVR